MERELFGTAVCLGQQIRYYLLTEGSHYGAGVEYCGERVLLTGLTPVRAQAESLLEAMAGGCVTPVTAGDVAEDWLKSGNH